MRPTTAALPPVATPATPPTPATDEGGRPPLRPVQLHPTPNQLSRAERAVVHSGVISRAWRFRWRDEPAVTPGVDSPPAGTGARPD